MGDPASPRARPLGVSPHGIGIAVGYLAGAQLMVRRARGPVGPDENDIWNVLFYALIGAIVGARVGYVLGHLSEVTDGGDDLLGIFKVWEGGISLIGGITGAVLFGFPYMFRNKMGFWRTMDLAAPGLALGIVIGRIGDLIIGDHLGKPTDFALGWRCLGERRRPRRRPREVYLDALDAGEPAVARLLRPRAPPDGALRLLLDAAAARRAAVARPARPQHRIHDHRVHVLVRGDAGDHRLPAGRPPLLGLTGSQLMSLDGRPHVPVPAVPLPGRAAFVAASAGPRRRPAGPCPRAGAGSGRGSGCGA